MIKIYIDQTGDQFLRFSPVYWARWINAFFHERAFLLIHKEKTPFEELKWMLAETQRIRQGKLIKILAIDEEKNEVVGVCDVRRKTPDAHLHNVDFGLAVHRNYRRQGWGRRLLSEGLRVARELFRAKNIWIEVVDGNEPAIRLYKKMGFKEVCRLKSYVDYYGEFRDRIIMKYEENK